MSPASAIRADARGAFDRLRVKAGGKPARHAIDTGPDGIKVRGALAGPTRNSVQPHGTAPTCKETGSRTESQVVKPRGLASPKACLFA